MLIGFLHTAHNLYPCVFFLGTNWVNDSNSFLRLLTDSTYHAYLLGCFLPQSILLNCYVLGFKLPFLVDSSLFTSSMGPFPIKRSQWVWINGVPTVVRFLKFFSIISKGPVKSTFLQSSSQPHQERSLSPENKFVKQSVTIFVSFPQEGRLFKKISTRWDVHKNWRVRAWATWFTVGILSFWASKWVQWTLNNITDATGDGSLLCHFLDDWWLHSKELKLVSPVTSGH